MHNNSSEEITGEGLITAVAYRRVSTKIQEQYGYSLEQQTDFIKTYAAAHGFRILYDFYDDESGFNLQRKGLLSSLSMLKEGKAQAVIVHVMDRLVRGLENQIRLRQQIFATGAQLHLTAFGQLEDTPEGNLLANSTGLVSQFEIENFRRRSLMGRQGKAKSGKWVGTGPAPYGLRRVGLKRDVHLEIDEEEAGWLRKICGWYLGRNGGNRLSMDAIVDRLNVLGVPSPGGALWTSSTLSRVLRNPAAIGVLRFMGLEIKLPDIAIVDLATWDAVQASLDRNKANAKRNRRYEYLLAGHIKCVCGMSMIGDCNTYQLKALKHEVLYLYYSCIQKTFPKMKRACYQQLVRADLLDVDVWQYVLEVSDETRLREWVKELETHPIEPTSQLTAEQNVAGIDREIAQARQRMAQLMRRYAADEREEVVAQREALLSADVDLIEQKKVERAALVKSIDQAESQRAEQIEAAQQIAGLRYKLFEATYDQKRTVLDIIGLQANLRIDEHGQRLIDLTSLIGSLKSVPIHSRVKINVSKSKTKS